ncbi:helix-turn-helix domain-containing protein [Caproicibacterium amylolyticum]|uniref:Helix-turn-helix domain-containing protein n=1 Tax=Caproicibacterium amylolyticum TaxID=2766537 RepID=A0A7G9WKU4_9FIRM|nr:helix-turn-helix domain-containing protein [Caproicibacterium amylolyticum]QNO19306.1 helix-turn-helix domain-containing protein [Caproicibacterium amylolyticum]
MDKPYSITELEERKRGQHLGSEERGAIERLKRIGLSNRAIAREINCYICAAGRKLTFHRENTERSWQGHSDGRITAAAAVQAVRVVQPAAKQRATDQKNCKLKQIYSG